MEITLYYTPHTRSLRPRWLLEELGATYQIHPVDLFGGEGESAEYKKINPYGAVPALQIDGQVQLESGAMCHWLADQFPDKDLAPVKSHPDRMKYEQWMFYAPGTLEPPPFFILLHSRVLPEAQRVEAIVPWALQRHQKNLAVLENELSNKDYLLGDVFSAADIMVGSTLMWLPDSLKAFPELQKYCTRLQERPAYQRATADY